MQVQDVVSGLPRSHKQSLFVASPYSLREIRDETINVQSVRVVNSDSDLRPDGNVWPDVSSLFDMDQDCGVDLDRVC